MSSNVTHGDVAHALNTKQRKRTTGGAAAMQAGDDMAALMMAIQDAIKQPSTSSFKPAGSAKQVNSVRFPVTILDRTSSPTKGFKGGPPGVKWDYLLLVENFGSTDIPLSVGERTSDGRLILKVKGVQGLTDDQLKVAETEAAERDAKQKRKTASYVPKKREFDDGFEEVPALLRVSVFAPVGPFKDDRMMEFKPGARVYISGIEPVHKYKPSQDPNVLEAMYGVQFTISNMLANTNVASSNTSLSATWRSWLKKNYIVNFFKGEGGGWSPKYTTDEDRAEQERWKVEKTVEKNRFRAARHYMKPSERPYMSQPLVIPFGDEAERQPWHFAGRQTVQFIKEKTVFDNNWIEKRKEPETPLRLFNFNTEAVMIKKEFRNRAPTVTRHAIEVRVNDRVGEDVINRLGIVHVPRYEQIAPCIVPAASGFFIGNLSSVQSEALLDNDPQLNPMDDAGRPSKGVHSAAAYTALRIDLDVASGVVRSPHSFEITADCAKEVMRAQFQTEDASEQTDVWAKENPLNQGAKQVLNMFECNDKIDNIKSNYTFFLVFKVNAQARQNVGRARAAILRKKLDPVVEMSRLFFTPQDENYSGGADTDQDDLNGMPRPNFADKSLAGLNSYCLFAVRNEEVTRLRNPTESLSPEELLRRAREIEAEELAKLGPLPEAPADPDDADEDEAGGETQQQAGNGEDNQQAPHPATPSRDEVRRSGTPERQQRRAPKGRGASKAKKPKTTEALDDPLEDL